MRALLWVGTALAVAVEVWFLVAYGCANYDRVVFPDISWHPDLETFHRSAVALLHGDSVYDTGAKLVNLNPPVWTVVFAPFGLLSPMVAYWVFGVVTTVLFVGCMVLVARELGVAKWAVIVPLLVSSPFMGTFGLGQVYAVLLTGLTGYWLATR
ncbi:glycosyltransferase family 87 protein, partial [Kibdelosporangium lantanae]